MNTTTGIKAYTKIGIESGITAADPHKLISMLYEGALLAIAKAKNGILLSDIPAKCAAISKALAIIDEGLKACLDYNAGGELAQNLSSLYDYMIMRLVTANLKNDVDVLNEISGLLTDLKGAWDTIRQSAAVQAVVQPMPATKAQLTYEIR
jgi:flagellar protein FliS